MLLRIAQADAYCVATEYLKFPEHQAIKDEALQFTHYCKHPVHNLLPGQYSDDTMMSIGVSEVLISGQPYTKEKFANAFVKGFHRDPREGYAKHFQAFLEKTYTGEEFIKNINPDSDKNGAAMRSVPLGILKTPKEVLKIAKIQAQLTHNTTDGIISSQVVALMSHYALNKESPLYDLHLYLERYIPGIRDFLDNISWYDEPVKGPRVGMKTAKAVLKLLTSCESLMEILETTIKWGGDTDSVAAIAWGIASCKMTEDVPEFLERDLEPGGKYGVEFLKSLGNQLMQCQ